MIVDYFFLTNLSTSFFNIQLVNKLCTSVTNFLKVVRLKGFLDKIGVTNPKFSFFYPHFPQTCV